LLIQQENLEENDDFKTKNNEFLLAMKRLATGIRLKIACEADDENQIFEIESSFVMARRSSKKDVYDRRSTCANCASASTVN